MVNKITGCKLKYNDTIKTMYINDITYNINDNPKEASNVFNKYFTDVGKNVAKKCNKTSNLRML